MDPFKDYINQTIRVCGLQRVWVPVTRGDKTTYKTRKGFNGVNAAPTGDSRQTE